MMIKNLDEPIANIINSNSNANQTHAVNNNGGGIAVHQGTDASHSAGKEGMIGSVKGPNGGEAMHGPPGHNNASKK